MKRRDFIKASSIGVAAASIVQAPAIIASPKRRWSMVTTWPKNFPGLGTGANLLANMITTASDGRLTVKVYGAKEIVPAFEAMDAVSSGTVEMGHGASYYWKGKVTAAQYLSAMPFGLTAQEMNAWYQYGGGQQLGDEIYAKMGCKFFPSGNSGVQMGGWYNKEINSLADYKGLKIRIPGLGGEVVRAAGGTPVNLPGGEIAPALQTGTIDATEFVGPYNDLAFGLYKSAKYYYSPGWHEPATCLDNFVNLKAWHDLPKDLKAIVTQANQAVNQLVLSEFVARNNTALQTLVNKHHVELRQFSDETLIGLGKLSTTVLEDLSSSDALSGKVYQSIVKFRASAIQWSRLSEQSYLAARDLALG